MLKNDFLLDLSQVKSSEQNRIGGKAYFLGRLFQSQIPVPPACILRRFPVSEEEWTSVFDWWRHLGLPTLAVRSSAAGEDSSSYSFAGQNLSFLNVTTQEELRTRVKDCFASISREASLAYRRHFLGSEPGEAQMNVVLQKMITPEFSGVFFSVDPRQEKAGWVVEAIAGFGEELVSGHKTPARFTVERSGQLEGWTSKDTTRIAQIGLQVQSLLGFELDMEWAKDRDGNFWVLQARPITTLLKSTRLSAEIKRELKRLSINHPSDTLWDGQTFSEWTGIPTPLTFSIWKHAFSTQGAFGKALSALGYIGSGSRDLQAKEGVLEQVFGRAFVNSKYLEELYFGNIAYTTVPKPRPHLEFFWNRVNWRTLKAAPRAILRMIQVGWRLQTSRKEILLKCRKELQQYQARYRPNVDPTHFRIWKEDELVLKFYAEISQFSENHLKSPFMLILVAESTLQVLRSTLAKIQGEDHADQTLQRWMGIGVHTITLEMDREFMKACINPEKRTEFLAQYGHRGPGELDLSSPRWAEMGAAAFPHLASGLPAPQRREGDIEDELTKISGISGVYGSVIRQEWELLRELLELREIWKCQLLRSYAQIRWIGQEIATRTALKNDIYWLKLHELKKFLQRKSPNSLQLAQRIAQRRKDRAEIFSHVSLSGLFTFSELQNLVEGNSFVDSGILKGDGISPGMGYGEIRIVKDPGEVDLSTWPEDVVLVAEATDPGWTPLFLRAKAVVVEKGGILSHCAIVAREMGLPAVSGIQCCNGRFKEGDHVWVDGSNGTVRKS